MFNKIAIAILTASPMLATFAPADETGFHPDVGDFARIVESRQYRFPFNFGPTGATGWFYEKEFVVNGIDKGSPADGVLKIGERIRAVNGRPFTSTEFDDDTDDPRRIMGTGITESETKEKGGRLVVTVWRAGKQRDLTIQLPVMGSYSDTWPYDCEKSTVILNNACQWLADNQLPNGAFVENRDDGFALGPSLNGLLLLSSGDPRYLENARRLAYHFVDFPGRNPFEGAKAGTDLWGWSYQALFVTEYYLRTGDTHVLPYLEYLKKIIFASRGPRGGWSHGFKMAAYAVGGYINPNAVSCLTSLALMEDAGLEVDKEFFDDSKHYLRRWSYGGRGIHYGDHKSPLAVKPAKSFGAGKNALAAIAFEVMGEQDVSDRFALTVVDTYRHRDGCHAGPFFSLFWGPIAASRCTDEEFRMFMNYWTWFHDLSRRWDGSFLLPSNNGGGGYTSRGPVFTMGGQALVYALPLKTTRVCGARQSPFAAVAMPEQLVPVKILVQQKQFAGAAAALDEILKDGSLDEPTRSRGLLMKDSLETTLESIEYTLAEIEKNLERGESILARTRIHNLEDLLGRADGKLLALKQQAASSKHDRIADAWQTYRHHRLPSYILPTSYKVIQELARDKDIGFVQAEAQTNLEAIRQWPSYKDSFCSESILAETMPLWEKNKRDPIPLAVMRLLAFGDGIIWTAWSSRGKLEADGLLGDFPHSTILAPTSQKGPQAWRYQTMDEFTPPARWNQPGFDDSAWQQTHAPVLKTNPRDKESAEAWDKQHLLMRRTFDVKDPSFLALRIKALVQDEVDIYLNGRHVARIVNQRRMSKSYIDFDVSVAGLPALKKGENVLAVKATKGGGHVDIGLLGVKRY